MRRRWLTPSAIFLVLSILGIVTGAILRWGADDPDAANVVWALTTVIGIFPIGWEVLSGLLHRQPGVDLIAAARDGWRARARGVPRRRGDRVHARDRADARGLRGRPRAPGALRADRTRAAHRPSLRGRLADVGARSGRFGPATCCSSSTARSCRWTACSSRASACSTSPRSPASPGPSNAARASRCVRARSTPARRSTCGRSRAPTGARTPASSGSSSRRRGRRRRSSAWPTATR